MKRLKSKLLNMDINTATYSEMYEGHMLIVPGPTPDYNATYYNENIGFEISTTHKLAQDKPTVTVYIPYDEIFHETKGDTAMKRLKYFLLQMDNNTTTYKEMYEGRMFVHLPPKHVRGVEEELDPEIHQNPQYWHDDLSVDIDSTHRLAQDKPTLTWNIPTEKLGFDTYSVAARC